MKLTFTFTSSSYRHYVLCYSKIWSVAKKFIRITFLMPCTQNILRKCNEAKMTNVFNKFSQKQPPTANGCQKLKEMKNIRTRCKGDVLYTDKVRKFIDWKLRKKLRISFPSFCRFVISKFQCFTGIARFIHQTFWHHIHTNFHPS